MFSAPYLVGSELGWFFASLLSPGTLPWTSGKNAGMDPFEV